MPKTHHLIDNLLQIANKNGASDLIARTNDRIRMRITGDIITVPQDKISAPNRAETVSMVQHLIRHHAADTNIEQINNLDFHYTLENTCHFRIHVLRTNNNFGIVDRLIPAWTCGLGLL